MLRIVFLPVNYTKLQDLQHYLVEKEGRGVSMLSDRQLTGKKRKSVQLKSLHDIIFYEIASPVRANHSLYIMQ